MMIFNEIDFIQPHGAPSPDFKQKGSITVVNQEKGKSKKNEDKPRMLKSPNMLGKLQLTKQVIN